MKKFPTPGAPSLVAFVIVSVLFVFLPTRNVTAQTINAEINLPYIIQFGFGSYDVGGLTVDTVRIPVPYTFTLGRKTDSYRFVLTNYLGYGHAYFETGILGPKVTLSQDFAFLLPNLELQIPLREWWTVKPYVAAGFGRFFNGNITIQGRVRERLDDNSLLLYAAGIGNIFELPMRDFLVSFGTKVGGAWAEAIGESGRQGFCTLQNGVEVRHPLGFNLKNVSPDIGGSFTHYHFFPAAKFSQGHKRPLEVTDQFEIGVSVGSAKPAKLWIFENPRIGMSYRFGDGLTGFRVNFGFPF